MRPILLSPRGSLGILLVIPLAAGCGPGQGKVTGRVTFNGAPLPGGTLFFRPADPKENSIGATLDDQGNYQAVLPAGEVQVSVDNRALAPRPEKPHGLPPLIPAGVKAKIAQAQKDIPAPKPAAPTPRPSAIPGKYVEIPHRYYDIKTSELKFTVQRGSETHNIELTK